MVYPESYRLYYDPDGIFSFHFLQDLHTVSFHGAGAQEDFLPDLLIGEFLADELNDFDLFVGKFGFFLLLVFFIALQCYQLSQLS